MQKNIILILLFSIVAFSCEKSTVDKLFDESANTRAATLIEKYKTQLAAPQYGWKGTYYPDGANAGGYSFYLKFDIYGGLTMYSDVAGLKADQAFETTYQVKSLQKPTLIFDTYSYLHELVNPDYNGGTGKSADLELIIDSATDDKITLTGTRNNTEMVLTKLSSNEFESVKKGGIKDIFKNTVDLISSESYTIINFPTGDKADVFIDLDTKIVTLYFISNNSISTKEAAFYTTPTGIQFRNPIVIFGSTIQELIWDNTLKTYYYTSGSNRVNLVQSIKPAMPFYFALGTFFSSIVFDPDIPSQSTVYKNLNAEIKAKTIALSTAAPVRVIGDIYFYYIAEDGVFALVFDYTRTYTDRVDSFGGVLFYAPVVDANGNITFTRQSQTATLVDGELFSGISPIISDGVKSFTDILEQNKFNWDFDSVEPNTATLKSIQNPTIIIKGTLY
ncbi:MAG: DUF4302 domain-containing protein [Bacteroidota bacterium]